MKFLDERIIFEIEVGTNVTDLPEKGVYTYELRNVNNGWEDTVFIGNFYYNKTFNVTLDVTDIVRNSADDYKSLYKDLHTPSGLSLKTGYSYTIYEYYIELKMKKNEQIIYKTSNPELVANVYRYLNRSKYTNLNGTTQFINYNRTAFAHQYNLLLQGLKYSDYRQATWDNFALVPKYPCKMTENYAWGVTFGHGWQVSSIPVDIISSDGNYSDTFSLDCATQGSGVYSNSWISSLSSLLEDYFYYSEQYLTLYDVSLYYETRSGQLVKMCDFETCYSRYYLQWKDRFGSIQSQPFRENITYSEDFKTEEIISYDDKRRINNVQVQPKWKIYSGWIRDELYPYYESIFTSPFLILYDTETDMNYEVIVKGNYVEKNYKNQKGLLNLELNLEAAETQNIVY